MNAPASVVTQKQIERLLLDHARSFALTLRLLPGGMREPLSLTYLLARATDTIADAGSIPREERLQALESLQQKLNEGEAAEWHPRFASGNLSDLEEELMEAVPSLILELKQLSEGEVMLRLWQRILEGQLFDLRRFPSAEPLHRAELEQYCYLVAGSVGEAWTELIENHAPQGVVSRDDSLEMKRLGAGYGKGLQLLNILRDRASDREMGRIYASDEEIPELLTLAESWLNEGEKYLLRLKPGRIRYGTTIPLRLAWRTLELIKKTPCKTNAKVQRWQVYAQLLWALPSLVLPEGRNPA